MSANKAHGTRDFSGHTIELDWTRRVKLIPARLPFLRRAWEPLILYLLPVMESRFSNASLIIATVLSGIYGIYSLIADIIFWKWRHATKNKNRKLSILIPIVLGHNTLLMIYVSLMFYWSTVAYAQLLNLKDAVLLLLIIVVYATLSFMAYRNGEWVNRIIFPQLFSTADESSPFPLGFATSIVIGVASIVGRLLIGANTDFSGALILMLHFIMGAVMTVVSVAFVYQLVILLTHRQAAKSPSPEV